MRRPLFLLMLAALVIAAPSHAQSLADEQQALIAAKKQAQAARQRSQRLKREAGEAREEAERARRQAAALAAGIQAAEADIQAAQARVAIIARLQRAQNARLAERQEPIVRLTAALQLMARRPPATALVQPGSISDLVHLRAVLANVLPLIRARTAGLRAELEKSRQLRADADQARASLVAGRLALAAQRTELHKMEMRKRFAARALASTANLEADRAVALGEKARDIVDLMDQLRVAGNVREELALLPGPLLRPSRPGTMGLPKAGMQTVRRGPPAYRMPVMGEVVTGMGELSEAGVRARGLTIATQPLAQVVAPTRGRIAFAGKYRGYGEIVIIDHGNGWTSLLANLDRLSVDVGTVVRQGDPIGSAGQGRPRVLVELRRNGRPVNIAALLG
ncbi:MAG TPA: peptidoglycan DD-metalloendopeptidase family protein [Rhizorhapis sp.]|nr:peptidoglycan DD-metalloendopeptidase family protein [Rhizorhapis sp.]